MSDAEVYFEFPQMVLCCLPLGRYFVVGVGRDRLEARKNAGFRRLRMDGCLDRRRYQYELRDDDG